MPQAEWVTSSWALVMQTRALLRKTRDRIALNSRLNPWWGVSGSSDGVGDGALMRSVLDRLERGVLFPAPSRMWAGKGTGQICSVCAQTIHPDEVENEVAINDDGLTVKLWAHIGCLDTWRHASEVYREEHPSSFTDSVDGDRI